MRFLVVEYLPACEVSRMSCFRNLMVFLLALTPVPSLADGHRIVLSEDFGLSAVCWESPYEHGWEDFSDHSTVAQARYDLWVLDPPPPPAVRFYEEPIQFRLTVGGWPCYYEYGNHRYRGAGTLLTSTVPTRYIEVDGRNFPYTVDPNIIVPIIRLLVSQCEQSYPQPWPFTHLLPIGRDCEREVSDILLVETTAVQIYLDPNAPDTFETVVFVQGVPYLNGEPLVDPAVIGLR
ncbi:hypothetical protein Jann_1541 [Jannaschia sp. CCS1]|nr:hypothetical protein Jann_1541 [Jannaschia sp. CCS1]